ncbi:phosphatidylserine decarboxylase [Arthroderma uncinatum]|uniref:phosphatidylserine decarboxylase n=1 Tax=Arthroderma uncinatum TaxID=74035 RepID=UPI00144A7577|nr:phosphatidylserine decarboxylase [Arthroderma uncinatum]KAF3490855.1 phosphatidylserine decarboxylase [Arthroderma uncinatum]
MRVLVTPNHAPERWLGNILDDANGKDTPSSLAPVIQEFKDLIETDPILYMLATSMFDEIPNTAPYRNDPTNRPQVRSYRAMLHLFNILLPRAPEWYDDAFVAGLVGFPFNAVLNWPMNTNSGRQFFLHRRVNDQIKRILSVWGHNLTLTSSIPQSDLERERSWFGDAAIAQMTRKANLRGRTDLQFHELFDCQQTECYGYKSWDQLFTRKFSPGIRPLPQNDSDAIIVNACESSPLSYQENVSKRTPFWLKGSKYSLQDILGSESRAHQFSGGTVYQAFLSAESYHRWNSPVSGTIVEKRLIKRTYFATAPGTGFASEYGPDARGPDNSQLYITHVATRAAIFIEARDPRIGLMCFLAVEKGDELGMFRGGGSTHCLIFRNGVKLDWIPQAMYPETMMDNLPVRTDALTPQALARMVREAVAEMFGDWGMGKLGGAGAGAVSVKYLSPATSTAIIRCPRASYRLVWSALTYTSSLPSSCRPAGQEGTGTQRECVFRVVRVSGTMKKAELEAIRRARNEVVKLTKEWENGGKAALEGMFTDSADGPGALAAGIESGSEGDDDSE